MKFQIIAKGHPNIQSKHKSTFEITKDPQITLNGDCIVGVDMNKTMNDFPQNLKQKIAIENNEIIVKLKTKDNYDEIIGYGHPKLTLNHPTDIVCRKSDFICSRTLMIKSNKAACDLNPHLIDNLKDNMTLSFKIVVE